MPNDDVTLPLPGFGIGRTVAGRYLVRARLGAGGMGAVYRVLDTEIDEEVALKILFALSGDALARFRREVKLARRVTHANVARTYDLGRDGDIRYLTMELIDGESLRGRHGGSRVALAEALRIAAEVARGLAAAHAAGVVHRDLKPDNILLARERVVITDFGIARLAQTEDADPGQHTANIVGTPAYMAPEQVEGAAVDGRTDVFALGVVLFELLAGQLPFRGDTAIAAALARLTAAPIELESLAQVPTSVAEIVRAALGRRREDRPDAAALLERLEAARGRAAPLEVAAAATLDPLPAATERTTIVVRPFDADERAAGIASDLASAVADALACLPRIDVVPPEHAARGDVAIEGSVRLVGERVRTRVRVVDVERKTILWAEAIEGTAGDPFALEDRTEHAVIAAIRERVARDADTGPTDPVVREKHARARAAFERFDLASVREAIRLCEEILAASPNEPHTMGLLAVALIRQWLQQTPQDVSIRARAEELALRALAGDPALAEPYHAIAQLRFVQGELRAGLRAEEETLRRMPLHAGAHSQIGRYLCEAGRVDEGMRRIDLALRLDPNDVAPRMFRASTLALLGDKAGAYAVLDEIRRRSGPMSALILETRFAVWFDDRELAARSAELIRSHATGAAWERAGPVMEAIATHTPVPDAARVLKAVTLDPMPPRHRALMFAIASEYYARMDLLDEALATLEQTVLLPTTDLLWLDRCEALAPIRAAPRFAAARAVVAARVAELWS